MVKSTMISLASTLRLELLPLGIQVALLLPYAISSRSTLSIQDQVPQYTEIHPMLDDTPDPYVDFSRKTGAMLRQVFSPERLKETEVALEAVREIVSREAIEREYRVGGLIRGSRRLLDRPLADASR